MYNFLRPTECAEEVLRDIEKMVVPLQPQQAKQLRLLLRQLVRDIYEDCAQTAEDFVCKQERDGQLPLLSDSERYFAELIGDRIAECFRRHIDERKKLD